MIAIEAITDRDGDCGVFVVAHDKDELRLGVGVGYPGIRWSSDDRFVFVRPR